jgi:hypothetical protein
MGSSDEDFEELEKVAKINGETEWSCLQNTKSEDVLFFYFTSPRSAIVASGIASQNRRKGRASEWPWMVSVRNIHMINPPINLKEMRDEIPDWGWLKKTRKETYLNETRVTQLNRLLKR